MSCFVQLTVQSKTSKSASISLKTQSHVLFSQGIMVLIGASPQRQRVSSSLVNTQNFQNGAQEYKHYRSCPDSTQCAFALLRLHILQLCISPRLGLASTPDVPRMHVEVHTTPHISSLLLPATDHTNNLKQTESAATPPTLEGRSRSEMRKTV